MSTESNSGVIKFLSGLSRLILIILVGVIIGALLYFAITFVYNNAVLPTQNNTTNLSNLDTRLTQTTDQLRQDMQGLQGRLTALENQHTTDVETIAELTARLEIAETEMQDQSTQITDLEKLAAELDTLQTSFDDLQTRLTQLEEDLSANATPNAELTRQIQLVKAMQMLMRARLDLLQNDFGRAKANILNARDLVAALASEDTPEQNQILTVWVSRLNSAAKNLPDSPILAENDLEVAWQLLATGFPGDQTNLKLESGVDLFVEDTTPTPTLTVETPSATIPVTPTPAQ